MTKCLPEAENRVLSPWLFGKILPKTYRFQHDQGEWVKRKQKNN